MQRQGPKRPNKNKMRSGSFVNSWLIILGMPQPGTRSNRQACDAPRSCTTPHRRGCLPDFAGWSGYPTIAACQINAETDAMGQYRALFQPNHTDRANLNLGAGMSRRGARLNAD